MQGKITAMDPGAVPQAAIQSEKGLSSLPAHQQLLHSVCRLQGKIFAKNKYRLFLHGLFSSIELFCLCNVKQFSVAEL